MNKPIIHMSESGKCAKALCAQLQNLPCRPKPEWLEQATKEGNWHEQRIKDELRADDIAVVREQEEVKLSYPTFDLVGHIDSTIYDHDDKQKLLEVKSMSQFEFDRWMRGNWEEFPAYAYQITCYMIATELRECIYIVKNRNNGYVDKRTVTKTPLDIEDIVEKLCIVVMDATHNILPDITFNPNSLECRRCLYRDTICLTTREEMTKATEETLHQMSKLYREGIVMTELGESMTREARKAFEEHTKAAGIDNWKFDNLSIVLVYYRNQVTYPKAKLLTHFTTAELVSCAEVKQPYDQLRITDLDKKE